MEINTASRSLLFATALVEAKGLSGDSWTGTAFFYNASRTAEVFAPFLVSNTHVLDNAETLVLHFIQTGADGAPALGQRFSVTIENPREVVFVDPLGEADIAVISAAHILQAMLDSGHMPFYSAIDASWLVTPEQSSNLDAVEEVMFVGYPNGLYDQHNLRPIIRRGTTATPVQYDYNGMPAFVIDAAVYPGSSGSPVVLISNAPYVSNMGFILGQSRTFLLGVLAAVHTSKQEGVLVPVSLPSVEVNIPMGLGIVYRWDALERVIDACFAVRNERR